jgi:hypothetical protein
MDRLLYDRINARTGATGYSTAIEIEELNGILNTRDGIVGGGTFPGTVTIDQRGEIHTGFHVEGEVHGTYGTIVVGEGGELVESAIII